MRSDNIHKVLWQSSKSRKRWRRCYRINSQQSRLRWVRKSTWVTTSQRNKVMKQTKSQKQKERKSKDRNKWKSKINRGRSEDDVTSEEWRTDTDTSPDSQNTPTEKHQNQKPRELRVSPVPGPARLCCDWNTINSECFCDSSSYWRGVCDNVLDQNQNQPHVRILRTLRLCFCHTRLILIGRMTSRCVAAEPECGHLHRGLGHNSCRPEGDGSSSW